MAPCLLPVSTMSLPTLTFEYTSAPDAGSSMEILPGLHWLRQPLPMSLNHINVWLLHDDNTFAIVDTGINSKTSRGIWEALLKELVPTHRADKVVATHLHPDHVGLAGWLCNRLQTSLWMTRAEYFQCRVLCEDTGRPAPVEGVNFYRAAGVDATALTRYQESFGRFGQVVSPLPQNYVRIQHGDRLRLGRHDWEVVIGSGHSPEHACLYSETINTVISGDQILPSISSIVAVWPTEPEANPLHDWLHSCRFLQDRFPRDALVLPSHGIPFRGIRHRLQELIVHHEEKLDALDACCRQPQRAVDVFELLFRTRIDHTNLIMAVGEAVAHFNYLRQTGVIRRYTEDGVHWYERI